MVETKKTFHEGAEYERKAFKAYLKRQYKTSAMIAIEEILTWVQDRCNRYKKAKGGL